MAELLASKSDIQKWLPADKISIGDGDTDEFQIEVNRTVKAMLTGVFTPSVLHAWATPGATPAIIRSIAGELIAAYVYRKLYSEDSRTIPAYAQGLYDEAVQKLKDIRAGLLAVLDDNDVPITGDTALFTSADFYPNNSAPGPYFTMDREWA